MKALILVGGFGTRLRPLTLSKPKPIVEFCNKAMVLHQIEALQQVGVEEVILAVNYRPELMSDFLAKAAEKLSIKISYSQETEPLGTAGPLALARKHLSGDHPFFVLNSDVICGFPFKDMLTFHKAHGKEGTILVTKVEEPSKYGVVVHDKNGLIDRFVEKPKEYVGNMINAGLYLFNPSILDRIELRPTSIEKETFPAMASDHQLYAMPLPGFWMDVGQPPDYLAGMSLYLSAQLEADPSTYSPSIADCEIIPPVLIHPTASIGSGSVIGPHVVIGPDCKVGSGVRLHKVTVLAGVRVEDNAYLKQSIIGWNSSVGRWVRCENVSVLGEDVHLKDELYINGCRILPHKTISKNLEKPEIIM